MDLVRCAECNKTIFENSNTCPHCGAGQKPIKKASKSRNSFVLLIVVFCWMCVFIVGILLLAIICIGVYVGLTTSGDGGFDEGYKTGYTMGHQVGYKIGHDYAWPIFWASIFLSSWLTIWGKLPGTRKKYFFEKVIIILTVTQMRQSFEAIH
jgi:hypothetical protein